MDARTILRRYLEQRRELGESELVLDSLTVDDVMRLLGAASHPAPPMKARPSLRDLANAVSSEEVQDWRASLRDAGVNVDAPVSRAKSAAPITEPPAETTHEMAFKKGIVVAPEEAELIPSAIMRSRSYPPIP